MAKDQTAILQQVVAELRQLNKSSKIDLIREQEALDRQERMAVAAEETGNTAGEVLSDGQDFQRRFIAGQAKTLIDKGRLGKENDEDSKPANRGWQRQTFELQERFVKAYESRLGDQRENEREKDKDTENSGSGGRDKSGDFGKSSFLGKAAKGAAAMGMRGLGLGGFMSGLMVWSGVEAFRGENFPEQAKNLKDGFNHIGGMETKALIVMGSMVAAGGLFGATLGVGKSIKGTIGMTAVGLGLGGFMAGLMAPGELTDFDGATFPALAENLTKGFNHLGDMNKGSLIALGSLATLGAVGGPFKAGTAAVGMAAAGVGLGAFMTGIAASGDITKFKGDHFAAQAKNIAEGLGAFSDGKLAGLTALMVTGAVLGPAGSALAATGMGLIGVGIGAFVGGIAGIGDVLGAMGVDGSGLKTMLDNISGGLNGFNLIDGKNFATLGSGMASLGIGLAALFGVNGLTKVTNFFSSGWESLKGMFGFETDDRSGLEKLLDDIIKPFESIDFANWNTINAKGFGDNLEHISRGLNAWTDTKPGLWAAIGTGLASLFTPNDQDKPFEEIIALGEKSTEIGNAATAMEKLARAMKSMTALNFSGDEFKFSKFAHDLVLGTQGMQVAMYGGTYDPPGWAKENRSVTIGAGKGLSDIPPLHFEAAGKGITILQRALNNWDGSTVKDPMRSNARSPSNAAGGAGTTTNNITNLTVQETVTFKPMSKEHLRNR